MAATTDNKSTFQPESDVHITFEDQQMINKFAQLNANLEDLKDELKAKQDYLKVLEDACDELMLVEGEMDKVPYFMGEAFINQDMDETQKSLEELKSKVKQQMTENESKSAEITSSMSDLRTKLYAKFGNHINLEADKD